MGGPTSGRRDADPRNKAKSAIAVCGSGVPARPCGLDPDVLVVWERIADMTAGLTFEQDSFLLEELADATIEQKRMREMRRTLTIGTEEWESVHRSMLANARLLQSLWHRIGLDPRSRQSLLKPSNDEPELDEFEQMMRGE